METPMSTRRVTRSQASAIAKNSHTSSIASVSWKTDESGKSLSKSSQRNGNRPQQQQDRAALIDITNDSPIVGLAIGGNLSETPASSIMKRRSNRTKLTPGSGEALLRDQVQILLQKVEEESQEGSRSLSEQILDVRVPPTAVLPPTSVVEDGDSSAASRIPVSEAPLNVSEVVEEGSVINRSLLWDFTEKLEAASEASECCSVVSYEEMGVGKGGSSTDDDGSSVWSILVNASACDHEEEREYSEESSIDELCEEMKKMKVNELRGVPKFAGKHTRFVYNSEDEIGEEVVEEGESASPGKVRLRGVPTPKGKHLRFPEEED